MDKLLLGLLMTKKLTVYEIRTLIRQNFSDVCSDSLGAIQSAIKKLLDADMVIFHEYVEKSVNKKRYAITDKGRKALVEWLHKPANIGDSKNMDLAKILFMGILPKETRASLLDEVVAKLEEGLQYLLQIQAAVDAARETPEQFETLKNQLFEEWSNDAEYFSHVADKFEDMAYFQHATLRYGIDLVKFNIEWFKKLKLDDEKRDGNN